MHKMRDQAHIDLYIDQYRNVNSTECNTNNNKQDHRRQWVTV